MVRSFRKTAGAPIDNAPNGRESRQNIAIPVPDREEIRKAREAGGFFTSASTAAYCAFIRRHHQVPGFTKIFGLPECLLFGLPAIASLSGAPLAARPLEALVSPHGQKW